MHYRHLGQPPEGFVYPVISLQRAIYRGVSADSLLATANWNERHAKGAAKFRRLRQARALRAVAADLVATRLAVAA